MVIVLLVLTVGILTGYLIRNKKKFLRYTDISINLSLYLLLLVLGISIGSNKVIIKNIWKLGIHSLLISISAILGSVLFSYITYIVFFRKFTNEK
jgi:uncharacterized membrane protein YbjE (DUF340 family)